MEEERKPKRFKSFWVGSLVTLAISLVTGILGVFFTSMIKTYFDMTEYRVLIAWLVICIVIFGIVLSIVSIVYGSFAITFSSLSISNGEKKGLSITLLVLSILTVLTVLVADIIFIIIGVINLKG